MKSKKRKIQSQNDTLYIPNAQAKIEVFIFLALGIGALYLPYFLNKSVFYSADLYPFFFTGQRFWWECFHRSGVFPLWNPYINLGTSFLYNSTWGIFYPLYYIQAIISPLAYFRFGWLFHLVLLAWALFRWCRIAGVNRATYGWISVLVTTAAFTNIFSVTNLIYLNGIVWSTWILSELELRHNNKL